MQVNESCDSAARQATVAKAFVGFATGHGAQARRPVGFATAQQAMGRQKPTGAAHSGPHSAAGGRRGQRHGLCKTL